DAADGRLIVALLVPTLLAECPAANHLPLRLLPLVTARPRTQAMPDNNQNARRETWTAIVLLWLAGNALRLTILAVPPVIAMIRDEFALSATEVGLLSSIP